MKLPKKPADEGIEDDDEISFVKLQRHINEYHPRDENQPFGICDHLGRYSLCGRTKVSLMAKELGLGPAIFLMSTKALTLLFFFLTIINVPVYAFFYQANDVEVQSPQDYFAKLSIGNLG